MSSSSHQFSFYLKRTYKGGYTIELIIARKEEAKDVRIKLSCISSTFPYPFNLTPMSDQDIISPYNVNAISSR